MPVSDKPVRIRKCLLIKEIFMNHATNAQCNCSNCPGAGCQCGCQTGSSITPAMALPPQCNCAPACGCEGAEQGCVCA